MKRTYSASFHVGGSIKGEAIVSRKPLSFLGGVNTETGEIVDEHNDIYGQCIGGKILIYPYGKGSTGDCMRLWRCVYNGKGPIAIINTTPDPIHVEGALLADIPIVFGVEEDPTELFKTGDFLEVNNGKITVI